MGKEFGQSITVQQCKFGQGLFASANISKGTTILNITGNVILFDESVFLGDSQCYPIQIGLTEYIAPTPDTIWQFINHSCEPNCGINNNLQIIALTDIKGGDELFFDYSTSMLERYWTMNCECGSSQCRIVVSDFDTLPIATQQRYIQLNVVQPFILAKLNE